jgi:uncharacterized lipoprotein YmbA
MTTRPLFRALSIAAAAALATGCFGAAAKPTEYFTLSTTALANAGEPLASLPQLGLAVGPMDLPRHLDRQEIVTRDGSHRVVVEDSERWGGSLREDILRVVADDLGALLGTNRVAIYPAVPRFALDYQIMLDLREFEGRQGESVRLRAYWTVVSGADGKGVAVGESQIDQPVASPSWADFVAAHSTALGAMTRQIAARVAELPAKK